MRCGLLCYLSVGRVSGARFIVGDVFDALATLEPGSVDLVMTSPPFLALRSYLPAGHVDKAKEIGSEATPADFIDTMLDVVEACRRVLAPHGSLVFEIGDTYSGSGGAGGDYNADGLRAGQNKFDGSNHRRGRIVDHDSGRRNPGHGWPLDKSLTGVPTIFAWSLAYGRNLLRPERTIEPWRIRNLVAWARPNPPVGALGDKFRPATSYLTVATVARDRWFDMDAVRVPAREDKIPPPEGWSDAGAHPSSPVEERERFDARRDTHNGMAPLLDWWAIPTQPYKGSHYATFPEELPKRVILSMCPERVCRTCGGPSRRIVERESTGIGFRKSRENLHDQSTTTGAPDYSVRETLGWTDCGHDDYRPGHVLDPFGGSGTTGLVGTRLGRDVTLIDLDERNVGLAQQRIGLFLTDVTYLNAEVSA